MKPKAHKLTDREKVQVIAALRYFGRAAETCTAINTHPSVHPMVASRFKDYLPLTLDELETLIGQLDGTWTGRGLRTWDGAKYL